MKHSHTPQYIVNASWEKLYNAIREGEPFPITTEEALAVMRVISQVKADNPIPIKSY